LIVASRTPGLGKESSKMVVGGGGVWNVIMRREMQYSSRNTQCLGVEAVLPTVWSIKSGGCFEWGLTVGRRAQTG
jgi:hypothetical protein